MSRGVMVLMLAIVAGAAGSCMPRPVPDADRVETALQSVFEAPDSALVVRMLATPGADPATPFGPTDPVSVTPTWSKRFIEEMLDPAELLETEACEMETAPNDSTEAVIGVRAHRGAHVAVARMLLKERCVQFVLDGKPVGVVRLEPPLRETLALLREVYPSLAVAR